MPEPYSFWYSAAGLVVGTLFFFGGVFLLWNRLESNNNWRFILGSMRIEVSTRAPGVILATLGLLVIYFTRYVR